MKYIPTPAQIEGAMFLKDRRRALLADDPRTGKTGSTLLAAQLKNPSPSSVLIITTVSGRAVWVAALKAWAPSWPTPLVIDDWRKSLDLMVYGADLVIAGWPALSKRLFVSAATRKRWDLLIIDEGHMACKPGSARTRACYGLPGLDYACLAEMADTVWVLSGTPAPNGLNDLHPMIRSLAPERLLGNQARGWGDVTNYDDFSKRYCQQRTKQVGWQRWVTVTYGGQNVLELRDRLGGFLLRRTQAEVGIKPPLFESLPLRVSEATRKRIDDSCDEKAIVAAIDAGDSAGLDMHFTTLRRLTGALKVEPLAELVAEEIEGGYGKFVLMCWHVDVAEMLCDALADHGAVCITGATPPKERARLIDMFQTDPSCRVIAGQMLAIGEAVDLSAADELVFAEMSTVPKDMHQASLRITNLAKRHNTRVRVAAIAGSVEEGIQRLLTGKFRAINELLN